MDALVAALMSWLQANADYELDGIRPPVIRELSAGQLTAELHGVPHDSIAREHADPRVHALYSNEDGPNGTIFILSAADTPGLQAGEPPLENPVFRERLLHELVHHAQFQTGAYSAFDCKSLAEVDALRLGALYLRRHNAEDPLPQRQIMMYLASRCRS